MFAVEHDFVVGFNVGEICDVDHDGVHGDTADDGAAVAVNEDLGFVGEDAAIAVGIADGDVREAGVAREGEGAVVANGVAFWVGVDGGDAGFEGEDGLILGVGGNGESEFEMVTGLFLWFLEFELT